MCFFACSLYGCCFLGPYLAQVFTSFSAKKNTLFVSCIATHIGRCWIGDKGALMIWMGRCSLVVSVTWSAVYSKVNILGVLTSGYIINAIVSSLSLFIASYLKSMMLGRKLQSKLIRCIVWNLKNVADSHRSPLFHSCLYECMRKIMCTTLAVW